MRRLLLALLFTVTTLGMSTTYAEDAPAGIRPNTEVVIHETKDKVIYEYSTNGFVYAYKVTPKVGPAYYLIAADNEGNFFRADNIGAITPNRMLIPSWKIIEW